MVELQTGMPREASSQAVDGRLCGEKLALVSTDDERKWPLAVRILLLIGLASASWLAVLALPDLFNDLVGVLLDLLLKAAD